MKKLYQSERWKKHSREIARRRLKRRKLENIRRPHRNRKKHVFKGVQEEQSYFEQNFTTMTPPENFSLIKNPQNVILFMKSVHEEFRKGKNVHLNLKEIKAVSCETIAWLVSNIKNPVFCNNKVIRGNVPDNPVMAEIFKKSGFYTQVHSVNSVSVDEHDKIFKRTGKKVELKYIEKIITFATVLIYGQKTKVGGIYRTLVECMANTRDHASTIGKQHVPWWTTVFYNEQDNRACFTFLDNGVGIFKSIRLRKLMKRVKRAVGMTPNTDILREILEGTIASSTGIAFRGKGLPSIYRAFKRGQISRLVIISNDVYANFENGVFFSLPNPFKGTLLYWEHGKEPVPNRVPA